MTPVIVARASDDIFVGATITADQAPMASYDLDTFLSRDPQTRVRFEDSTLTITWTLDADAQGDILVIPWSNLDVSDPASVLHVTNDVGLDVEVPVPDRQANGLPRTIAIDLALAEPNAATRTADVWHLVITSNSVDVILGGAVMLYAPRRILDAAQWGFSYTKRHATSDTSNEYLTRYRLNYETQVRAVDMIASCEPSEFIDLEDWYDANAGSVLPGLLWIQLEAFGAYLGTWQDVFSVKQTVGAFLYDVTLQFAELTKGKPI